MGKREGRKKEAPPPADCPANFDDLPPRWQKRLLELTPSLFSLGMASVVSAEEPDAAPESSGGTCGPRIAACRAVCCSMLFALTDGEVASGRVSWDPGRPYLIALDSDGFCTHLDRDTLRCRIYSDRPLRCRRYDCRRESGFWEDGDEPSVRPGTFDHLP